jgi:alkylhydroperoxidase/carboxymuconolactone decarboxylase family protein YurZ
MRRCLIQMVLVVFGQPSNRLHSQQALEADTTKEEITETLRVAQYLSLIAEMIRLATKLG